MQCNSIYRCMRKNHRGGKATAILADFIFKKLVCQFRTSKHIHYLVKPQAANLKDLI